MAAVLAAVEASTAAATKIAYRSEIRVFHRGTFLCRAVAPELSAQTISLKDLQNARARRRRELRALDLLLLTVATPRKVHRDGIHCHGLRYVRRVRRAVRANPVHRRLLRAAGHRQDPVRRTYAGAAGWEPWQARRSVTDSALPDALLRSRSVVWTPHVTTTPRELDVEVPGICDRFSDVVQARLNPDYDRRAHRRRRSGLPVHRAAHRGRGRPAAHHRARTAP